MRALTRSPGPVAARLVAGLVLCVPIAASGGEPPVSEPPWTWASQAFSPRPVDVAALPDREAELQRECGRGDAGLQEVAARLVTRKLRELPYVDAESIGQMQRVAGEPHVWPRSWMVSGLALDHESTRAKLGAWARSFHEAGDRRCGVAVGYGADGTEVVAAVALDALADLQPLPTRVRVGTWLPIEARLLVHATGARVMVMGPTGRPRTVPTQLEGSRVRAQIALDQPGAFTVQVVADVAAGPRPVLEAELFAETTPWTRMPDLAVPGESSALPAAADGDALLTMIQSMRAAELLRPFTPDARLDAMALAHAERMQRARTLAHDVGDGDPVRRLEGMNLRAHESGENVAHARSVLLAHRALYASPSHRTNLLAAGFDRIGVGVATDADGSVWVVEEFADGLR
jgi:uncharacterized protein YkwD